jgi:UDP-N-acetylglucosamine diphosphorylase / glucose-1-phosphate thymidylyltransferase / UDP-N-acetylgalactosamine diphosphorylase / glucosamine-1-phosphate N-acetyltransferase / galactosamine-1-phosphate N-acetyltransferase
MQVILLCAGLSKRMQPLSDKMLFEFCEKELILHQIQWLYDSGYKDIIIVANQNNLFDLKKICSKQNQVDCKFAIQKDLDDGMKGAIEACIPHVKNEALIVNSNDIVEKQLFSDIMERSQRSDDDAIICGKVVEKYFPGGYLSIDKNSYLSNIIEKPGEGNEPSDLVNIVVHYFRDFHNFVERIRGQKNTQDDAYELGLKQLSKDKKIYVLPYKGSWQAIKYPWHILDANNLFLSSVHSSIHPQANIAKSATIKGNVFIEKGVKVFENAVISGPCYIGENTIIANGALVRDSFIGPDCVIGFNTEVARSYLRKKVWTHSNYIGDSIIDENVSLGAGTITGNLRLDETDILVNSKDKKVSSERNKLGSIIGSGTRIGIHCSLNPGLKVGKNSFIGGNILIHKDVEEESFLCVKQELVLKKNIAKADTQNRDVFVKKETFS